MRQALSGFKLLRSFARLQLLVAAGCAVAPPPAAEDGPVQAAEPSEDSAGDPDIATAGRADAGGGEADSLPVGAEVAADASQRTADAAPASADATQATAARQPDAGSQSDTTAPQDADALQAGADAAADGGPLDAAVDADQQAEVVSAPDVQAEDVQQVNDQAVEVAAPDASATYEVAIQPDVIADVGAPVEADAAADAAPAADLQVETKADASAATVDSVSADLPAPPPLLVQAGSGLVGCNDNNACTSEDRMVQGACTGIWKLCTDNKPCTVDACQPTTGACASSPSTGACNDGDACTSGDHCDAMGACVPGKAQSCDDGLPCSIDSCDPKTGCIHKLAPTGSACASDSWCLPNGACTVKLPCMGMPALCDDGEPCTIDWCEGQGCLHMPAEDNDHCDDGDPCTPMPTDKCKAGKCTNIKNVCACQTDANCIQMDDGDLCNGIHACLPSADGSLRCQPKPASAVVCAALPASSCKIALCDPGTGQCLAMPMQEGTWCDDGDVCSVHSMCEGGVCKPVKALQCSSPAGCSAASTCDTQGGCQTSKDCGCANCDDGDPCTIDDCEGAGCTHSPVQCSSLGPCLINTCKAAPGGGYQCVSSAVASVAPLAVPVVCSPFAVVSGCDPGYTCKALDDNPVVGWCAPTLQVPCEDGLACTAGDVCDKGACRAGPMPDCDDDNPCTLDSCGAKGCTSIPIPLCKVCVDQNFESDSWKPQWATWSEMPTALGWTVGKNSAGNGRAVISWSGAKSGGDGGSMAGYLVLRKLYADNGTPATLDFKYRAILGYSKCGSDDFEVVVNGQVLWRACESTPNGVSGPWQHAKVDLGLMAGGGFDIEFRAIASSSPQGQGVIEIDKVRVAGACDTACLAAHLDPTGDARDVPSSPIPHGFKLTSSDPSYVTWAPTASGGQLGPGAMTVKYAGTPPGKVAATATWRIAQLRPLAGSVLQFSARALLVGDVTCGADDLVVAVAGVPVVQICGAQPIWKNYKVDLSAWAGQTVDVTFSAVSGATASASAVYQVDTLTVTGACSYACIFAQFETPADTVGWWKGNTAGAPQWALQSDSAAVGDGSLGVDLGPEQPLGAVTTIVPAMQWRWPMPVAGATFEVHAKVTADTATCPLPIFRVRLAFANEGLPPTDPKLATSSPNMVDILQTCESPGVFIKHELEVGDPIRSRKFMPLFILKKPMLATTVGVRIDEFAVRCK